MPITTFWSNNDKAIGQTVSASIAAIVMAMEHNYKVLLISADINNGSMEYCFGAQESNRDIVKSLIKTPQINLNSGIDGLMKLADSNRVTPETIHDYTKIIFKNRLEVLYSPMNVTDEKEKNNLMGNLKNIIMNASRYYDQVIVDLKKGMKTRQELEILEILEMSNVVVANIEQGTKTIEKFLTTDETKSLLARNKVVWNICKYDKKSKYNAKNLARNILKKQAVYETHYNTLVLEAAQEGNLAELLIRFRTLKTEDENALLISKAKELVEGILLKYQETRMRI